MKFHALCIATLMATASFGASAAELSYNYLELDLERATVDAAGEDFDDSDDVDFDGLRFRVSGSFTDHVYGFAHFARRVNDDYGTDIDLEEFEIGLGMHFALAESTDALIELAGQRLAVEVFDESVSTKGLRTSVGVQSAFNDRFSGIVKANYLDGGDYDGEFGGTVGAQVKFNKTWGAVGEVEFAEDFRQFRLGLRASF